LGKERTTRGGKAVYAKRDPRKRCGPGRVEISEKESNSQRSWKRKVSRGERISFKRPSQKKKKKKNPNKKTQKNKNKQNPPHLRESPYLADLGNQTAGRARKKKFMSPEEKVAHLLGLQPGGRRRWEKKTQSERRGLSTKSDRDEHSVEQREWSRPGWGGRVVRR